MNSQSPPSPHVLVIAYDFPPHAAIGTMRTLRFVRHVASLGWRVTVLTAAPEHYRPKTPVDRALIDRVPPEVKVVRTSVVRGWEHAQRRVRRPPAPGGRLAPGHQRQSPGAGGSGSTRVSLLRRASRAIDAALSIPDQEAGWLMPAVWRGLRAMSAGGVDAIYSSAPPWTGQVVALALATLTRRPWVADFRDPWSRAPWREDRMPFTMRAAARLERRVVSRADAVLFATQANRDAFARFYGDRQAARFHVVTNGCDLTEFEGLSPDVDPDRFVLLHAGSLYGARNPIPILRALARAISRGAVDRERFRLKLLGPIVAGDAVSAARADLGLGDVVELAGRVDRRESLRQMVSASALLLVQPGTTVSIPGKIYEYLATGRPMLVVAEEGEITDLVRSCAAGVVARPGDEADIERGLVEIVRFADQAVAAPRSVFDGEMRAAEAARLLASVIDGRRRPTCDAVGTPSR